MAKTHLATLNEFLHAKYSHILGNYSVKTTELEDSIESIVNYYEDIIASMPGNVWWINKQCRMVACNKNTWEMLGLKNAEEFKGLTFEGMGYLGGWSEEATLHFKDDTLEVIQSGKPKLNIEEPPIPHANGSIINFLTSRVPLFDRMGKVLGVVGISFDITELKKTQADLKAAKDQIEMAHRAQSEFIANMSHDVKTPLTGLLGLAEILSDRLKGEELELARSMLMSGRQLIHFFENCLEVFKLENSDLAHAAEPFQLKELIEDINHLFKAAVLTKKLSFEFEWDNEIPRYLLGTSANVYRILLNLISNAVKFTHEGRVKVSAKLDPRSTLESALIEFSVEDTGIGIPQEKLPIIFDRFTKVTPSYKGIYEGSGIGLYFVKRLVDLMEGEIKVESQEDVGSVFTIYLSFFVANNQLVKATQTQEEYVRTTKKTPRKTTRKTTPPKILFVEDNIIAQRLGYLMLTSLGCEVEVVGSGEKALEVFEQDKYNLIFMDIGLPGIQGDMAAKLIRKMEQDTSSPIPIIALTAHIVEKQLQESHLGSINRIMSKPLSKQEAQLILDEFYF